MKWRAAVEHVPRIQEIQMALLQIPKPLRWIPFEHN
jgi:hypothetical protein